jgi:hypothetical protein
VVNAGAAATCKPMSSCIHKNHASSHWFIYPELRVSQAYYGPSIAVVTRVDQSLPEQLRSDSGAPKDLSRQYDDEPLQQIWSLSQ